MNFILFTLVLILSFIAIFLLYFSSEKNRKKIMLSPYFLFAKHPKISRFFAFSLLILALSLLNCIYSFSIAFVSVFILITPIILIVIFSQTHLKPLGLNNDK